jgi:hypothetical protein
MSLAIERNKSFVNIVGTVDLAARSGEILYVNPANLGTVLPTAPNDRGVELVVLGNAGEELLRFAPALRINACEPGQAPTVALIQEDVRQVAGMARIVLLVDGAEVARFDAPSGGAPANVALDLGPPRARRAKPPPPRYDRRPRFGGQVQRDGSRRWRHGLASHRRWSPVAERRGRREPVSGSLPPQCACSPLRRVPAKRHRRARRVPRFG